ncbi:MAG TPA: hypothetical protein VK362_09100 [Reyranella sp.]|nr:hypothetical protein [Reyranella sp.]
MGHALSWAAIKGVERATVCARLQLSPTTNRRSDGAIKALPGDWTLVVLERCQHPLLDEPGLQRLSLGCTVIAAHVEEHVMFSSAEQWTDGQRLWHIHHQGDQEIDNLTVSGTPPATFAAIERECRHRQATDVEKPVVDHIFEIPLVLAQSITTFKHDESPIDGFEALEWRRPTPWWRFW